MGHLYTDSEGAGSDGEGDGGAVNGEAAMVEEVAVAI
jgi:hypothetical protein